MPLHYVNWLLCRTFFIQYKQSNYTFWGLPKIAIFCPSWRGTSHLCHLFPCVMHKIKMCCKCFVSTFLFKKWQCLICFLRSLPSKVYFFHWSTQSPLLFVHFFCILLSFQFYFSLFREYLMLQWQVLKSVLFHHVMAKILKQLLLCWVIIVLTNLL